MKHRESMYPKKTTNAGGEHSGSEHEISKNLVGESIRRFRRQKKMSQDTLAAELGLLRQTISAYERGISLPDLYILMAMADLFEVTVDELIGRAGYAHPRDEDG